MRFFSSITQLQLSLFCCILIISSILLSTFLSSVGMIGLIVLAVFQLDWEPKFSLKIRPNIKESFQKLGRSPEFLVVMLSFFIVFWSGIYSDDLSHWMRRLRTKLPFLLLPFAFLAMPTIQRKHYLGVFYFLILLLFVVNIGVGINYLLHFEAINESMLKGQAVPTPRNHIRHSLMTAFGIISGAYLYIQNYYWKYPWERQVIAGITLFLLLFIHVLSVRSGLFVLYATLGILGLAYIYRTKRYGIGTLLVILLSAMPFVAYWTIPSFKAKVAYVRWDAKMYLEGKGHQYSDSERMLSLKVGWEIAQGDLVWGLGSGDFRNEVKRIFAEDYPEASEYKMPHNQFLFTLAGNGIVGLIAFLIAFFYPFFYKQNYKNPLFLALYIIIFISFWVEHTVESSMGIAMYILFLLLCLKYFREERERKLIQIVNT